MKRADGARCSVDMRQARLFERALQSAKQSPVPPKRSIGATRFVWHAVLLLVAVACFAAYGHFKLEGRSTAAMVSLIMAAVCGFAPLRDLLRVIFRIEGTALH